MNARAILWCGYVVPHWPWDFQWSLHDLQTSYDALVGIGVSPRDIYALVGRDDILPEGFKGRSERATPDALKRVLKAPGAKAAPLIFVATNHGWPQGLGTTPPALRDTDEDANRSGYSGRKVLSPGHLRELLRSWNGPQVLLIAACYSGTFLELGEENKRLVMASCKPDEPYHLEDKEPPRSMFLEKYFDAWLKTPDFCPNQAFDRTLSGMPRQSTWHVPLKCGSVLWASPPNPSSPSGNPS